MVIRANHHVNDNTGNGNVQPDRVSKFSQSAMPFKIASQGPGKGKKNERGNGYGKQDMGNEDEIISVFKESLPTIRRRCAGHVIKNIHEEKRSRKTNAYFHDAFVYELFFVFDRLF